MSNILERAPAGDEWQRLRCKKAKAEANLSSSRSFFGNSCGVTLGKKLQVESVAVRVDALPLRQLVFLPKMSNLFKFIPYTPNPLVHSIHRHFTSCSPHFPIMFHDFPRFFL